jgi:hypothetical protein
MEAAGHTWQGLRRRVPGVVTAGGWDTGGFCLEHRWRGLEAGSGHHQKIRERKKVMVGKSKTIRCVGGWDPTHYVSCEREVETWSASDQEVPASDGSKVVSFCIPLEAVLSTYMTFDGCPTVTAIEICVGVHLHGGLTVGYRRVFVHLYDIPWFPHRDRNSDLGL